MNSAADEPEPATHYNEVPTSLASIDNSQHSHVRVEERNTHCHNNDRSLEDRLSHDTRSRKSKRKKARHCKEAKNDDWLNSSQNIETLPAAQNGVDSDTAEQCAKTSDPLEIQSTDMLLNNPRSQQPQTALVAIKPVNDSSMTASLSPAEDQATDSKSASDEQQLKLSHSAKRRRRRHRCRKTDHRIDEKAMPNDEQLNSGSTDVGSLMQSLSDSNLPTQTSHSLVSGFGRTHIIFDSVNSDEETGVKTDRTTHLTCDQYDIGTTKDRDYGCDPLAADSIIIMNNNSCVETPSHLQHEKTASSGLVCSGAKKESSATRLPSETKVHHPAKNTPFANVQVYCRQRIKKSASATCVPHGQDTDAITSPLPKEASIVHHF